MLRLDPDSCSRSKTTDKSNMGPDLSSYLASRYLVADPKPSSEKRKRKKASSLRLTITDDDDLAWASASTRQADDDEGDGPITVVGTTAESRKAKASGWRRVGGIQNNYDISQGDHAAADAILAATAAENEALKADEDNAPILEAGDDAIKMSDGTHAGLQTAAAVSAQLRRRRREEQEEFERHRKHATEEDTVYRDATGKRIDISMKREEARRAAAEAERKEAQAKEDLKGPVQLEEARKRRELLEDAKLMSFSRTADDEDINRKMKEEERWNDPMMHFMSSRKTGNKDKSSKRGPNYAGAAPPNRYGIKPGYRWDGVDRGNGFEGTRFKAINRRERHMGLEYSWQLDE